MIDYNINLFEDMTTFSMADPSLQGGISNINFWAYKRVFSDLAWLTLLASCLLLGFVLTLSKFIERPKYVLGSITCITRSLEER